MRREQGQTVPRTIELRPPAVILAALFVHCMLAPPWALAAATTLGGVVAQADGSGVRIQVVLSGSFHYVVTPHADHVQITLDGVVSEEAKHRLNAGPVTGIIVRPVRGSHPRVNVIIRTRTPLEVVEESSGDHALILRLAPKETAVRPSRPASSATTAAFSSKAASTSPNSAPVPRGPAPAPVTPSAAPVPASPISGGTPVPAPSISAAPGSTDILAGRSVIPRAIRLVAGTGRLLQIDGLVRVAVSDPRILGAVPVSNRELLVNGRAEGHTTMYVWEGAHHLLAYSVEVTPVLDRLAGLRGLLTSLLSNASITVTEVAPGLPAGPGPFSDSPTSPQGAGGSPPSRVPENAAGGARGAGGSLDHTSGPASAAGSAAAPARPPASATAAQQESAAGIGAAIVLSGEVETQLDRQKAEAIARVYAPRVLNLLTVRRPIQIKLQVEVVELNRNALQTLGVTWGGGQAQPGSSPSLNGGVYNLQVITAPGVGTNGLDLLIAQLQALEQHGLARLLAEPSLVVLAGRPASLLLGGQVPIPISGPNGSVTIEYKDFGVILNAQPDYQEDGRVFLQITPEVSTLDFGDAIKVNGFTIPALRVRKAQTVVSLLPTQTLVLGGLLQHQDSELVQKIPLLGDLPIIGPLFRSRTFQHQETDLVIFVTPVLAEPSGANPLNP